MVLTEVAGRFRSAEDLLNLGPVLAELMRAARARRRAAAPSSAPHAARRPDDRSL